MGEEVGVLLGEVVGACKIKKKNIFYKKLVFDTEMYYCKKEYLDIDDKLTVVGFPVGFNDGE